MSSLTSWAKTVLIGHRRTLTDEQLSGDACALCGHPFTNPQDRADFGWIGLPLRRRAYACDGACSITTVDDTAALFRAAIPARQDVWLWHLGADDVPLATGPDGREICNRAYLTALDAQPRATVEITHRHGTLTTHPLPADHATRIREQAQRLGFTATTTPAGSGAAR